MGSGSVAKPVAIGGKKPVAPGDASGQRRESLSDINLAWDEEDFPQVKRAGGPARSDDSPAQKAPKVEKRKIGARPISAGGDRWSPKLREQRVCAAEERWSDDDGHARAGEVEVRHVQSCTGEVPEGASDSESGGGARFLGRGRPAAVVVDSVASASDMSSSAASTASIHFMESDELRELQIIVLYTVSGSAAALEKAEAEASGELTRLIREEKDERVRELLGRVRIMFTDEPGSPGAEERRASVPFYGAYADLMSRDAFIEVDRPKVKKA
jgi:hypothetical protein